jgi:SNF2 family DNA or RNA helicase
MARPLDKRLTKAKREASEPPGEPTKRQKTNEGSRTSSMHGIGEGNCIDLLRDKLPSNATEKITKGERKLVMDAMKKFGLDGKVSPDAETFIVPNIKTPLMRLQLASSGWMITRERSQVQDIGNGGIVAHDMGLGKSLMCIAAMVGNDNRTNNTHMAAPGGPSTRVTLIICDSQAHAAQWESEFLKHCPTYFERANIYRYSSSSCRYVLTNMKQFRVV